MTTGSVSECLEREKSRGRGVLGERIPARIRRDPTTAWTDWGLLGLGDWVKRRQAERNQREG